MIIEETEEVDELITQSAAPTPSPRPSMPFCFSPQSGRLVETVPDSQEQPLPASQDVIESSFFSHASIPEESADELFARAMSSMYAPEPTATHTPAAAKKRGRKRKSPERDEPAGDGHVNLTEVYKPRSVPATPVEYKWKSSLVRLPTSRDSQTEEVEEEVEDVDANSGDEEEEEFVPGTQEREAAPNLFVSSSTLRTEGHRPPREDNDDEIEDISDEEDAGFGHEDFKQPERPHWGHSRQPTLKGKEKSFDESGPEDIHVSEEEEEARPDDERPEDDYAPLSLPTPMFPTPPVMVNVKREEDIEQEEDMMDDRMIGYPFHDPQGELEQIEAADGERREDGMALEEEDDIEASEDTSGWPRKAIPIIKEEDMDEFSEANPGVPAALTHGESPPQLQKRFLLGRRPPVVPETSPNSRGRFLQMIRTPEKDTQSLGGAVLPGVATRRLVPSGFAMRLSRIVERFVSRMSVAMPTLPSMIPSEAQPAAAAGISIHILSLKLQSGLFTATAVVLPPANTTLEEATASGWKPEQVNVVFSQMVGKALNLDPEQLQTLHVLAPWHEVTVAGKRVLLTGNCVKDHSPDNLEDILCLLASAPAVQPPALPSYSQSSQRPESSGSQPAIEEGSTDELGVASQTHSHDGDADHGSKVGKLVGLSAYLPIGTEMPAFFGLVQRVYVLAFPPANADNHGQETTSLSCNLSALQAAPREPYSATLLLQDAHQNMCLLRIPASCVVQWQAVLLQGEGKVYRFSKLAVVSSCMSSQAIKEQGVASVLASVGADKRGTNVTLLVAHDESLAVEESDSAGDDDEEHAADAKAQLRAHYKPSQTHILRNIAPLLYPRASPAQFAGKRRVNIVCRVVAVVAAASKQQRYWAERPAAHTSNSVSATSASTTMTTTTLFVTDPSLPPLASGSSSSTHSYLVRLELPRWLPDGAVWDLPLVRDSLLYISNLLLRVEDESESGPALVADDFTCIKKACRPQEGPTTWLDERSAELPALASQAFPEEVITALEKLHAAIPSLHSFYAPNTHPLPLPSLHKGAIVRLTGKVTELGTPNGQGSPDPFYDACAHCRSRAERRESAMGEWWFCPACLHVLPSPPVRLCRLHLLLSPSPAPPQSFLPPDCRLRLQVDHEQVRALVAASSDDDGTTPLEDLDWPAVLARLVGRDLAADCVLLQTALTTANGKELLALSFVPRR